MKLNMQTEKKIRIEMLPLIDIVFITLVFFMTLLVFQQLETELSISVPKAEESKAEEPAAEAPKDDGGETAAEKSE